MSITDAEMMAATASITHESFAVTEVLPEGDDRMLVRLSLAGRPDRFAVVLPLPSSPEPKPWLYDIPRDAEDAAGMLADFLMEEVDTGCAFWGATSVRDDDRLFELTPYGFRSSDPDRHRRLLKSAGPYGWWGRIHENDDPATTPGGREAARLAALSFSYAEVGATAATMPTGYRTLRMQQQLGTGRATFEEAAHRLMTWDMHRQAGLLVNVDGAVAPDRIAVLGLKVGPWWIDAPVRVVEVIEDGSARGFSYFDLKKSRRVERSKAGLTRENGPKPLG